MMHTIIRKFTFDAGHRVYGHESKCSHVHGHTYIVEVECSGGLDSLGRVIDFSIIKDVCGKWIDDNLDHGMILYKDDPLADIWMNGFPDGGGGNQKIHKHFLMSKNPTAENIAEFLYKTFNRILQGRVVVESVVVHETPNCRAEYFEGQVEN